MTVQTAKRELKKAGVLPHRAALALRRYAALRAWWAACASSGGRDVTRLRVRVAAELTAKNPAFRVGKTALREWERWFRRDGVLGLARMAGDHKHHTSAAVNLDDMSPEALADYAGQVLAVLRRKLGRKSPQS